LVWGAAAVLVAGCSSGPGSTREVGITAEEINAGNALGDGAGNEDAPGDLACDDPGSGAASGGDAPVCSDGSACIDHACADGTPCSDGTCPDGSTCDANGNCNDGTPCGDVGDVGGGGGDACSQDDALNDPLPPELAGDPGTDTARFHFGHGAGLAPASGATARVTGYSHGKPMSIAVTAVEGKNVEVHTAAAFGRMKAAAAMDGVALHIVSGFRTMDKQRELYRAYKAGRGNLAAVPGFSNHQSGHALDLNTNGRGVYGWLTRRAATYGFRRTVPTEKWHWEAW
jgi:hypothetical protein